MSSSMPKSSFPRCGLESGLLFQLRNGGQREGLQDRASDCRDEARWKQHKILYRDRDCHGTTITALSSCGKNECKDQYGPFTPGFVEVPQCCEYRSQYPDASDYGVRFARVIESIIQRENPDTVDSIVLEPVTAGGGVITPPEGYWETVKKICTRSGVLLHIDEVVCGLGRTGKWFGYQHYGIKPDIVTMAKGVASGYAAIVCTVTSEEVLNQFKDTDDTMSYFRDISTFGGCAAGPAAALETMRIIEEEDLLENTTRKGEYLMEKMRGLRNKYKTSTCRPLMSSFDTLTISPR